MSRSVTSACTHCGLPVRTSPAEEPPFFCCSGCHLAFHLGGGGARGSSDPLLARVLLCAFLTMGVMVFSISMYAGPEAAPTEGELAVQGLFRLGALALSLPIVWLLGLPLAEAILATRRWLSTESLLLLGALAAFGASVWSTLHDGSEVWFETVCMILVLVHLGRWLDVRSRERVRDTLTAAARESLPRVARLEGGEEERVAVDAVAVGDRVRVRPGEVLAVDGRIREGRSFVETERLTGEEEPRSVQGGDEVLAGMRVMDGSLVVEVTAARGDRVRDAVERALRRALETRPGLVRIADRFAAVLLPSVLVLAGAGAWLAWTAGPEAALMRALTVVLIACPCALGIATPLAYWVALGASWRDGVAVRSGEELERLARAQRVFLDKTGTLTATEMQLAEVRPVAGEDRERLLELAAALETGSEHPIGRALRAAQGRGQPLPPVAAFRRLPGRGVEGRVAGRALRLVRAEDRDGEAGTVVRLLEGERALGDFVLHAHLRPEAARAVAELRDLGLEPTVLTGDAAGPARRLSRALGIPVESGLLPDQKVARIESAGPAGVVFVGDGLNDAAALAAADVGVAVRDASPTSIESADAVLLRDDLAALPRLFVLARRAVRTARANLVWACGYNVVGLFLALRGTLTPVLAAAAMVGSSALVVVHSMRLARRAADEDAPGAKARGTQGANRTEHAVPVLALTAGEGPGATP